MELSLKNGLYAADPRGGLVTVSGAEETAQRLLMKLSARRGGFAPWPDYGSRLYLLPRLRPSERESAARQYIAEALAGESGVSVTGLSVTETGNGELSVALELRRGGGTLGLNINI